MTSCESRMIAHMCVEGARAGRGATGSLDPCCRVWAQDERPAGIFGSYARRGHGRGGGGAERDAAAEGGDERGREPSREGGQSQESDGDARKHLHDLGGAWFSVRGLHSDIRSRFLTNRNRNLSK